MKPAFKFSVVWILFTRVKTTSKSVNPFRERILLKISKLFFLFFFVQYGGKSSYYGVGVGIAIIWWLPESPSA